MRGASYALCTVCVLLSVVFSITADGGKKSKTSDITPFRTIKMNYLWSKAVGNIADKEAIKRIKDKFEQFDTMYLSSKDHDSKYGKSDVEKIDAKLEKVLEKYGLEGAVSAFNKKQKWRNEEELRKSNDVLASEKFKDAKVQKLWRAAQNSKFSESQLKVLHKELKDHERRMDEYNSKVSTFNEIPHENALDETENREELSRDLKDHLNEMESNYDQLHMKVMNTEKSPFNNDKVSELWVMAMNNQNFTTTELESIRMDLSHFDKQMDKLKYHEDELETAKQMHKDSGKVNVVHEGLNEFEEKTDRIRRKLRKLGNFLETKIAHTEL